MKILIAGVGNSLRGDDGFGVAVAQALIEGHKFSDDVRIYEAGTAGIALVQELMSDYDALIIADAIDRRGPPGTVYLIEPEIPDADSIEPAELHRSLVDAHYADPSKVLLLAKALGVLPERVFIVGCQPGGFDELGAELSQPVRNAVQIAVNRIESLIEEMAGKRDDLSRGDFEQ
jgi:hydrogenase maturation protease